MRTMICPVSNSNQFEDCYVFFIFQFDRRVTKAINDRRLLFLALPFHERPTYMTWLCGCWGAWVDRKVVDRYLEELGMEQNIDEMIGCANEAVLLPGEQEDFNPETYSSDDDKIRVDCEQMIVTTTEVHFDCQFKNSSDLLSVSPINIEYLWKAVEEMS